MKPYTGPGDVDVFPPLWTRTAYLIRDLKHLPFVRLKISRETGGWRVSVGSAGRYALKLRQVPFAAADVVRHALWYRQRFGNAYDR